MSRAGPKADRVSTDPSGCSRSHGASSRCSTRRLDERYGWARARLKRIKRALTSDELEMDLLVQTPQALGSAPWLCWCHGSIGVWHRADRGEVSLHPAESVVKAVTCMRGKALSPHRLIEATGSPHHVPNGAFSAWLHGAASVLPSSTSTIGGLAATTRLVGRPR